MGDPVYDDESMMSLLALPQVKESRNTVRDGKNYRSDLVRCVNVKASQDYKKLVRREGHDGGH